MSTIDNAAPAPARRSSRGRILAIAGVAALALTAFGAGAVYSQSGHGWGGYGWGGHGPGGYGSGGYGPGQGGHGPGYGEGGPRHGGPGGWGHGGMREGMPRRGWMMGFGPERMINFALTSVGATSEQKLKITEIAQSAMNDLRPLRDRRHTMGLKLAILLKADSVDRAAIEKLRADEFAAFEAGSKRAAQAISDAADVLTPAQRQQLVERWENRMRR